MAGVGLCAWRPCACHSQTLASSAGSATKSRAKVDSLRASVLSFAQWEQSAHLWVEVRRLQGSRRRIRRNPASFPGTQTTPLDEPQTPVSFLPGLKEMSGPLS